MPFANYKDFNDCVRKNQDKENPEAYCGFIKHEVEDKEMKKENYFTYSKTPLVQTGDKVVKGSKCGNVISVNIDKSTALIAWDNTSFSEEPLDKLTKKESIFSDYINKPRRL